MAAASARYPDRTAIVDEHGSHTYAELWQETNAVANGLVDEGVKPGATVGILHRNSYRFISSVVAAAKVGASTVFLNTEHAAPQVAGVVESERIDVVLHDRELADLVETLSIPRFDGLALAALGASSSTSDPAPPRRTGRTVILTSGTTGRPKGAVRASLGGGVGGGASGAGLLERIPFRVGQTVVVAPPLFHSWGLAGAFMTLGLSGTVVLASRFDPEATLVLVARTRADALIVVPVMLHRMLALGDEILDRHDTGSLRIIASSGSAIGGAARDADSRTLRSRPVQRVRVDGSVDRDRRHARRPEGAAGHGWPTGARDACAGARRARDGPCVLAPRGECSSAAICGSTDTPVAAGRRNGTGCCRRATWATSTPPADS